jgi:hypothetical protein
MRRLLAVSLLAVLVPCTFAEAAGERRLAHKKNGGQSKGTFVGGTFHAPKALRAVLVATPRSRYTAATQVTCPMEAGGTKVAKTEKTVTKGRIELRVPIPRGAIKPTKTCFVEVGGYKGGKALGRTRIAVTLFGSFGPPVLEPEVIDARLANSYVGGYLRMDDAFLDVTGNGKPKLTYGWDRCDGAGANCAPIDGATALEYQARQADVGMRLRGRITATTLDGSDTNFTALTAPVSAEEFDPGG